MLQNADDKWPKSGWTGGIHELLIKINAGKVNEIIFG
jgi:hypothetical protein